MQPIRLRQLLEYVAANVARARVRRGLTQEQLASLTRMTYRTIQDIERVRANPSLEVLVRVANELGMTFAMLFRKAKLAPARRGRPPTKSRANTTRRTKG